MKIETIKNKVVTLFFVAGIDEKSVRKNPIKTEEVQEIDWISIELFI